MSKKILLVDDEPALVMLTKARLQANGYEVAEASSGMECLEKVVKEKPDLILLDIMMPRMDGFTTLTQLRGYPSSKSIPVIMFSAKAMQTDRERALAAGAQDYLVKPFKPEVLLAIIQKALI